MKNLFLFSFFILCVTASIGQRYNIARYGVSEGLLHSFVSDVTQDKRGNIWIATGGGLSQFNGVQFFNYTTRDGLNFTRLTCVAADLEGNIWTGSSKGVNVFNGKQIFSLNDSTLGDNVLSIEPATGSKAWIATDKGLSLVSLNGLNLTFTKIKYDFNSPEIAMIFQDRSLSSFLLSSQNGDLYYGSNGFLFRIRDKMVERISSGIDVSVNAGTELPDGTLIFATNKDIYRLEKSTLKPFINQHINGFNLSKIRYHAQKLWMLGKKSDSGSEQMFLLTINLAEPNYFRIVGKNNGMIESPTSLYIDHENNVWTGSNGGLSVLRGESFVTFTTSDGLVGNKIWGICQTTDRSLWLGTIGEGLSVVKNEEVLRYTKKQGLPDEYIGKIYQDDCKNIFLGTGNAGICKVEWNARLQTHTFKKLKIIPDQDRLRVDDIFRDNAGNLWVASQRGLYFSTDDKNFTHQSLTNNHEPVFIQKLLFDQKRERLWVATRGSGLFYIEDSKTKRFDDIRANEEISTISQDAFGDIWVGTRTRGIFRITDEETTQITEVQGISSNLIYILMPDNYSNLWIGTNLGLDKLHLPALHEGRIEIRHYGSDDGLLDLETNLNGALEDREGYLWFATNGGLLRYDQKYDISNRVPPKVSILSMKLHSQETDWSRFSASTDSWSALPNSLTLQHDQNHLTFDFVAISFKNPKQISYAWMLEGFDQTWIHGGLNRQAIYSNLPNGQYVFKLKAANNDRVWSEEVISMPIVVKPPFWATWWFRALVMFFLFLLVYLFMLWRIRSLKITQKELEAIVDIRTYELSEQVRIIDTKNHQILDSIYYAKFLQSAILPSITSIDQKFSDVFVLYKPKDVVSGDFYWYLNNGNKSIIAVADCTGHGVPGAIVSVVCSNALNQAVRDLPDANPATILERTRVLVIDTFSHGYKDVRDGMDIALCTFDHETGDLLFAGANSGLCAVVNGYFAKLKPNNQHIGRNIKTEPFVNQSLHLKKGDVFFMYSDGYTDQFGEETGKKFSIKKLDELLYQNAGMQMREISTILDETFENWKGIQEQIDDVVVLGIRV
jgi:ligand-binding sensor domain-containing protein/serine phosphatase RsbU (regulator of sigma subunit)